LTVTEQVRKSVDFIFEEYCSADVYILKYTVIPQENSVYDVKPLKVYADPIRIRGYVDIEHKQLQVSSSDGPRLPIDGTILLFVEDLKKVGLWDFDKQNVLINPQDRISYLQTNYEVLKSDPIGVIKNDPILVELNVIKLVDK